MRVLMFNLRTDVDDTALGFTTAWANALAAHCEEIDLVTLHQGRVALAPNIRLHTLGRERGYGRARLAARFYAITGRILARRRPDVCFAHMTPLMSTMVAPLARAARVPVLLWYAHGSVTRELRIAHRLATRCVTSTPQGFQLPSTKLHVLSQGIDTDRFRPPTEPDPAAARTLLTIGRITPVKRLDDILRAVALVRREHDVTLRIVGEPVTATDHDHVRDLEALIAELGLGDAVVLPGPVPYDRVPSEYHRGAIFINLSEPSLDKATLEAMASGCLPLARNEPFRRMMSAHGLAEHIAPDDVEGLARSIAAFVALDEAERTERGAVLREVVAAEHGLDGLAASIAAHLRELAGTS